MLPWRRVEEAFGLAPRQWTRVALELATISAAASSFERQQDRHHDPGQGTTEIVIAWA